MPDNLTPQQRSFTMSRIRSKNTAPELVIRRLLHARGLRFRKHVSTLPGSPDLAFAGAKVAVFVDGDFWHGWRFPLWQEKLGRYWKQKIQRNRERDRRNCAALRRRGWLVVRIWEHQVELEPLRCVERVEVVVRGRLTGWQRRP
jgi:DNA mismatch endonuclease (patch repair protein)